MKLNVNSLTDMPSLTSRDTGKLFRTFQPLNFGHWTILQFQTSIIETCLGAEGLIVEGKLLIFLKHNIGHSGSGRVSAKYICIMILITIKAFVKDFQQ